MQAVILAVGMEKQLKEGTQNNTKCMVKATGVTLIERMLGAVLFAVATNDSALGAFMEYAQSIGAFVKSEGVLYPFAQQKPIFRSYTGGGL